MRRFAPLLSLAVILTALPLPAEEVSQNPLGLTGIWQARRFFGPELRGELALTREGDRWTAEIGGHRVSVTRDGRRLSFEIPGDRGAFQGSLGESGSITGHWVQPPTRHGGLRVASPVALEPVADRRWRGVVTPFEDSFTLYLVLEAREDGTTGAFLRNAERNVGVFLDADRLERHGDAVELVGRLFGRGEERVLAAGRYIPDLDALTLGLRGAVFEFRRVGDDPTSAFYARGRRPEPWIYRAPPALDDGWRVGTLAEAGISPEGIRRLVETEIDRPASSVHDPYVHALLVARHGKLVLEEYFHGFHRDVPHDTRSASKSATAVLVGAAIAADEPVRLDTPVYSTLRGEGTSGDADPRAARMTLEHLLTMSSGLDCDDRDPDSPGNEERMQSQSENPDWYDYTLSLDVVREPGELAVYCSINPNLAGAVLSAATDEPLTALFHRLVAEPLDVRRYHLYLQPTGEPYMGGGIHWLPRDFMKLGQLMLDGGTWRGRRVLDPEFAARAISPLYEVRQRGYGYLWWVVDYPYRGDTVRAFFAGGNGGQVVIGVPELDLLVTFFAGNYSDPVLYRIQDEFFPGFILPSVAPAD